MESVLLSLAAEVSRAPRDAAQAFGPTMDHQAPALGLLVVMVGAFLVAALGYWKRRLAYPATLLTLLTFLGTAIYGLERVLTLGPLHYRMAGWEPPVGIELNLDALSAFVITMIALVSLLVCVYAGTAVRRENPERESTFYGMLLVMLLGLTGMVITADLFNLYVWFEVSSLAGYALMAIGHKKAPGVGLPVPAAGNARRLVLPAGCGLPLRAHRQPEHVRRGRAYLGDSSQPGPVDLAGVHGRRAGPEDGPVPHASVAARRLHLRQQHEHGDHRSRS